MRQPCLRAGADTTIRGAVKVSAPRARRELCLHVDCGGVHTELGLLQPTFEKVWLLTLAMSSLYTINLMGALHPPPLRLLLACDTEGHENVVNP